MCLINLAWKSHNEYLLIIAANRDEFFNRQTESIHEWKGEPAIIAGRDLEKLGTWLGITKTGKFSALTNVREIDRNHYELSRGHLVSDFLKEEVSIEQYGRLLANKANQYPGYNLLLSDFKQLSYMSNRNGHQELLHLNEGIYSISNADLFASWPKMEKGKAMIAEILTESDREKIEANLFARLKDAEKASDMYLPNTGVGIERERALSPMFIRMNDYGTRSSTVVLVDYNGNVTISEVSYYGEREEKKRFHFSLDFTQL